MASSCSCAIYFQAIVGDLLEPEKYNVDVPNKLVIKDVQLSDGRRYSCSVMPSREKEIANLIVIGRYTEVDISP